MKISSLTFNALASRDAEKKNSARPPKMKRYSPACPKRKNTESTMDIIGGLIHSKYPVFPRMCMALSEYAVKSQNMHWLCWMIKKERDTMNNA